MAELTTGLAEGGRKDVDISRELVRIHAHYYGRGPTRAKTYFHDEVILCMLGGIFTPSEEMLVEGGRFNDVRANRMAFQDTVEPLMRAAVEKASGRRVDSFLSQISPDGHASEVFTLVPDTAPEPEGT